MNELDALIQSLSADTSLRERFAAAPRRVMEELGIDSSLYDIPDSINLKELNNQLDAIARSSGKTEKVAMSSSPSEPPIYAPHSPLSATQTIRSSGTEAARPQKGLILPGFAERRLREDALVATANPDDLYQDAWFGSFGTAVSRSLISKPKDIKASVMELVIGNDDRVEIQNPQEYPFRWVASLIITAGNGSIWLGTGWFAAPRVVITAGHCVYMHNQGGWVRRVDIFPARKGAQRPFTLYSTRPHSVTGWVNSKQPEYDYGALILDNNQSVSDIGYFGVGALSDEELSGLLANLSGYPADKAPGTLWGCARYLEDVRPSILRYDIDTYGGMSGAPVIRWDANDYIVVGIHNYGDLAGNQAARITPETYQNLTYWSQLAAQ